MRARQYLHLAASVLPIVPALLWTRPRWRAIDVGAAKAIAIVALPGIVGIQLALLLRWSAVIGNAKRSKSAWLTGLSVALIAHAIFGALFSIESLALFGQVDPIGQGLPLEWLVGSVIYTLSSLGIAGFATLPITALLVHLAGRRCEKEWAHEPD